MEDNTFVMSFELVPTDEDYDIEVTLDNGNMDNVPEEVRNNILGSLVTLQYIYTERMDLMDQAFMDFIGQEEVKVH